MLPSPLKSRTTPTDTLQRQIQGSCAQCHKPPAWKPASFEHDKLFLLNGDHNATCPTCHVGNDYSRYTCLGCHEHTPSKIRAKHEKEGIRNFENGVACHRSASEGNEREGRGEGRKKD